MLSTKECLTNPIMHKTGKVFNVTKRAVGVIVNKQVRLVTVLVHSSVGSEGELRHVPDDHVNSYIDNPMTETRVSSQLSVFSWTAIIQLVSGVSTGTCP